MTRLTKNLSVERNGRQMNGIHKKSALPKTGEIILAAHDQGEGLFWERYEQQLPLCGFTRNGLVCRKCFKGPCRINPFGDEPSRGICGADRDQIVMENVFQTTLDGVLETARNLSLLDGGVLADELPDFSSDLPSETRKRLIEQGLLAVRKTDLFGVQNSYFSHKSYLSNTLKDLTRLGLIQYGLLREARTIRDRLAGAEVSADKAGLNILVVGQASLGLLEGLRGARHSGDGAVHILVQGSHAIPGTEVVSDHGDPELALAMNVDALVVTPNGYLPGLEGLAEKYDIPTVLVDGTKSVDQLVTETMTRGRRGDYVSGSRVHRTSGFDTKLQEFLHKQKEIKAALKRGTIKGVVVFLGEATVKQAFFERTLTLMESCLDNRIWVLLGGELGAQGDLLTEEVQKRMGDRFSSVVGSMVIDGLCPPTCFGSLSQITRVVSFFKDLMEGETFASAPGMIVFPEFFRASSWATAVSLLSLGFMVQIGSPLPFWGSAALTEVLLKDWPDLSGGRLLASPAVPDGETQAREILSHLEKTR